MLIQDSNKKVIFRPPTNSLLCSVCTKNNIGSPKTYLKDRTKTKKHKQKGRSKSKESLIYEPLSNITVQTKSFSRLPNSARMTAQNSKRFMTIEPTSSIKNLKLDSFRAGTRSKRNIGTKTLDRIIKYHEL